MDARIIPPSAFLQPPPPPHRGSDGNDSSMLSKTTISGGKLLYLLKSRTRLYYVRRCKKASSTNIESLPDELVLDILVRLPADFLYDTARAVCVKWYQIIHSYAFVNTQFHHSTNGLLLSVRSNERCHPIYVTATQGRIETVELSYKCRTKIMASCNGLALELHQEQATCKALSLHVINLATKQPFIIPSISTHSGAVFQSLCGIAYDAVSMEYKLTLPYLGRGHLPCLDILTVGVDKSWRNVGVHHLPKYAKSLLCLTTPLNTEGFIHWGWGRCCLTLNMETEVITMSEVPLPHQHDVNIHYYYLSTGRYLSLLVGRGGFSWDIWEMKPESGEWKKLLHKIDLEAKKCRLQHDDKILEPFGWVKYLEVLAFKFSGKGRDFVFYNLDTHEITTIQLPNHHPCTSYRGIAHRNSLVWLS